MTKIRTSLAIIAASLAVSLAAVLTGPVADASYITEKDFFYEVAAGRVAGMEYIHVAGCNDDIDTGTVPETIWPAGSVWVAPTTARTHDIVSTSADDAAAGTGARTVKVYGIDASWAAQTETVTMNGTTNVATANTYERIYKIQVLTAGSGMRNAGDITATAQTDATVTCYVEAGDSISHSAIYTVPDNKTLYIKSAFGSTHRAGSTADAMIQLEMQVTTGIDGATPVATTVQHFALAQRGLSGIQYVGPMPSVVTGPADVEIRCSYVTDSNMHLSAGFDGVLE